MPTINQLKDILEESKSLKLVTEALGELSAMELKSTRDDVEQNTIFFNEIAKIYQQVQTIASRNQLVNKKTVVINPKNSKTISILLTSNRSFYGGLDRALAELFISTSDQYPGDKLVIGNFGITYLLDSHFDHTFEKATFEGDLPTPIELQKLVDQTISYSRILLYHPKFITPLRQEPEISDITQGAEKTTDTATIDYILEPELDKMLGFFENQLLTLLFKAIFLQSRLSRTAARMISMYEAELNVEKEIMGERQELIKKTRDHQNILILETYAGLFNRVSYLDK